LGLHDSNEASVSGLSWPPLAAPAVAPGSPVAQDRQPLADTVGRMKPGFLLRRAAPATPPRTVPRSSTDNPGQAQGDYTPEPSYAFHVWGLPSAKPEVRRAAQIHSRIEGNGRRGQRRRHYQSAERGWSREASFFCLSFIERVSPEVNEERFADAQEHVASLRNGVKRMKEQATQDDAKLLAWAEQQLFGQFMQVVVVSDQYQIQCFVLGWRVTYPRVFTSILAIVNFLAQAHQVWTALPRRALRQ
jgi:hypothetical protein